MEAIMKKMLFLLLVFIVPTFACADSLVLYPQVPGAVESTAFSVTANGQAVFVEKYKGNSFAHFSFDGKVEVDVTVSESVQNYTLSPKSYNIESISRNDKIMFSLDKAGKLILHKINALGEMLFIFADSLEINPPQLGQPGVTNIMDYGVDNTGATDNTAQIQLAINELASQGILYFPPGKYKVKDLYLKSDITIYLEGGARLWSGFGLAMFNFQEISNTTVRGRGMIDGHMIRVFESPHITINGILHGVHPDGWWALETRYSDYFHIDNMKIINEWSLTSDGIDLLYSNHALVENVFVRSGDDALVVHAKDWELKPDIWDVTFRNAVIYAGSSGCKISTETHNDLIADVIFENIDIVSFSHRALSINPADGATIKKIRFKNIRVENFLDRGLTDEGLIYFAIWTRVWPPVKLSQIEDIYVSNLISDVEMSSKIHGYDETHLVKGIRIENFYIDGNLIATTDEGNVITNNYVENLTFGFNASL
jgi:hypothetical protein